MPWSSWQGIENVQGVAQGVVQGVAQGVVQGAAKPFHISWADVLHIWQSIYQ